MEEHSPIDDCSYQASLAMRREGTCSKDYGQKTTNVFGQHMLVLLTVAHTPARRGTDLAHFLTMRVTPPRHPLRPLPIANR